MARQTRKKKDRSRKRMRGGAYKRYEITHDTPLIINPSPSLSIGSKLVTTDTINRGSIVNVIGEISAKREDAPHITESLSMVQVIKPEMPGVFFVTKDHATIMPDEPEVAPEAKSVAAVVPVAKPVAKPASASVATSVAKPVAMPPAATTHSYGKIIEKTPLYRKILGEKFGETHLSLEKHTIVHVDSEKKGRIGWPISTELCEVYELSKPIVKYYVDRSKIKIFEEKNKEKTQKIKDGADIKLRRMPKSIVTSNSEYTGHEVFPGTTVNVLESNVHNSKTSNRFALIRQKARIGYIKEKYLE